jgi:hypothetical protein
MYEFIRVVINPILTAEAINDPLDRRDLITPNSQPILVANLSIIMF